MTKDEIYRIADDEFKSLEGWNANLVPREMFLRGFQLASKILSDPSVGDFFDELASALRNLWPKGEKDGKYPWRDSQGNIVKRLQFLWNDRHLGDKYSIDDCLTAARRYLSQFENDARFMQTLKYFIFKQTKIVAKDGHVTYTYKSTFADLLETSPTDSTEWDEVFESSSTYEQGVLI